MTRILRRLRCELSASHLNETRPVICAHGPTVHTHYVSRCERCGKESERASGESLASLVLGTAALLLWGLALKGGVIVRCTYQPDHDGDHSWKDLALREGGRVIRPEGDA